MKRKILLLLVCLMILPTTMVIAAQAQDVVRITASVEYNELKGKVYVNGNLSTGKGQWVTIQLIHVGESPVYFDQIHTGEDGDFSLSISIPEPRKGLYELRLGALDLQQVKKITFNVDEYVPATSIRVNPKSLILHTKNNPTAILSAEIEPANATEKQVIWKSENSFIATVDANGRVHAVNPGTTNITASLGALTDQVKVTVNGPSEEPEEPGKPDPKPDPKPDLKPNPTKPENLEVVGGQVIVSGTIDYEISKQGQTVAVVQLEKQQLTELLALDNTKSNISVVVNSDSNAMIQEFRISLQELQSLHKELKVDKIVFQNHGVTYEIPVLDTLQVGNKLGQNTQVALQIEKLNGEVKRKIETHLNQLSSQSVSDLIKFNLTMAVGTKVQQSNYLSSYGTKSIKLNKVTDSQKLVAVLYDLETNRIRPVPTVIEYQNGQWTALIKDKNNGIYTVVENHRYFTDLQGHWSQSDVELLANRLIINGVGESAFDPEGQVTRAQFAAMLVRALGIHGEEKTVNFLDIDPSDWYAEAIGTAVQSGIVAGYTDGNFQPNKPISRQELTIMLQRAAQFVGIESLDQSLSYEQLTKEFYDSGLTPAWAQNAMSEAIQRGWIRGRSNTQLVPQGTASRAEAAVMIKRLLQDLQFINQ